MVTLLCIFQRRVPSTNYGKNISASDAARKDQVNAVVEEGMTTNVHSEPDQSAVYGF